MVRDYSGHEDFQTQPPGVPPLLRNPDASVQMMCFLDDDGVLKNEPGTEGILFEGVGSALGMRTDARRPWREKDIPQSNAP